VTNGASTGNWAGVERMRNARFGGSNRNGLSRWARPSRTAHGGGTALEGNLLAQLLNEIALGIWLCVSILGIMLGLLIASAAQVWARTVFAPGAVLGAAIVLASLGATLVAAGRYLWRGPLAPWGWRDSSRWLAAMGVFIVGTFAWAALGIIFATSWDFPASLLARAER